jgi:hypothetical protein
VARQAARTSSDRKIYLWVSLEERSAFRGWLDARPELARRILLMSASQPFESDGNRILITPASIERAVRTAIAAGAQKDRLSLGFFGHVVLNGDASDSPLLAGLPVVMLLAALAPPIAFRDWNRLQQLAKVISSQA